MTARELIDRLCVLYGVANPNQLAPLVGFDAAQLYSWRNKHEPSFENTMRLLEVAGVLNFDDPEPREPPMTPEQGLREAERALDDLTQRVQELELRLGSASGPRPNVGSGIEHDEPVP